MTTKKQRRENTENKTRAEREALAELNLSLLAASRTKSQQRSDEMARVANKKKARSTMLAIAEAAKREKEAIPENLQESIDGMDYQFDNDNPLDRELQAIVGWGMGR